MIDVALLSVIRRWHLREGIPIREIARRTKLSRNTIRKYLVNGQLEPVYPKRINASKLTGSSGSRRGAASSGAICDSSMAIW